MTCSDKILFLTKDFHEFVTIIKKEKLAMDNCEYVSHVSDLYGRDLKRFKYIRITADFYSRKDAHEILEEINARKK